jgi:photosystem II stability/assembly factor-like uncharacterized protein
MKRYALILLCLCLSACGTFDIRVQISPRMTDTPFVAGATSTPQPAATLPATATQALPVGPGATPEPSATPDLLRPGQPLALAALQMSDTSHGWALESSGHIVKTIDGGLSWLDVTPAQGKFGLRGLFALNNDAVWAVPADPQRSNVVWRTRDSGSTWQASQPLSLGSAGQYSVLGLQFPDARHGWLLLLSKGGVDGNHIMLYKSVDGGVQWDPVPALNENVAQSYLPDTNTTMVFADGQTGWLGGWWGKDNPKEWLVLKTGNGGGKWGTEGLALPGQPAIGCDELPVPQTVPGSMAVDVTCTSSRDPKYLFHHVYYLSTSTPPVEWDSWKITGQFLSAAFLNPSEGWMLLSSATQGLNKIQSTDDGGKTWTTVSYVAWKQAQFDFVTAREGWAVVGDGFATALVHTANGGKLWVQMRPVVADQ